MDNAPDPDTGVVRLRLSNGISVNYRHTDNEPQAAMIRMVAAGGRACEGAPDSIGSCYGWQRRSAVQHR